MSIPRIRRYLRRLVTEWVVYDPWPTYSRLDRRDGLVPTSDPYMAARVGGAR